MTEEERAAFIRARDIVETYAERHGLEHSFITELLNDLATYQRKVGVASLALLAQSAEMVDKRRAGPV